MSKFTSICRFAEERGAKSGFDALRSTEKMVEEYSQNGYTISTDSGKLDFDVIHGFLKESYWAQNVQFEKVKKSCENALCFGVYAGQTQVGFARVVTDYARFAYLADVFILEEYRGKGLAGWLMQCIMSHPELQGLTRWLLATDDAHGLYEKSGFKSLAKPEIFMEIKAAPDL